MDMMAILVEPCEGGFRAALFGLPQLSVCGPSKGEAIEKLQSVVTEQLRESRKAVRNDTAELYWTQAPYAGPSEPIWPPPDENADIADLEREMVAEIYRRRDAIKAIEFPE